MTRGRSIPVTALILVAAILVDRPTHGSAALEARVDAFIQKYVELEQFNGSALVAKADRILLKKGYGMANFEWGIPNTPDTRFRLGSITKQFTSMLIMQLVEEGKLSPDDKLADK